MSIKKENKEVAVALNPNQAIIGPWIKLRQRNVDDDIADPLETAKFLDKVFDIDSCIEEEQADTEEINEPSITIEEFDEIVKTLNYSVCAVYGNRTNIQVEIHKSDDGNHTIQVIGGTVKNESKEYVEIDEIISIKDSNKLDVYYRFNNAPSITINSSTECTYEYINGSVVLSRNISGSIRIKGTIYVDVIDVEVSNIDETCTVLGFFSKLVDSLDLEIPEIDETITDPLNFCSYDQDLNLNPDKVSCYKLIHYLTKCKCSQETIDRVTVEESVDCGDGDHFCPGGDTECRKLKGSETHVKAYVDCGEIQEDISDPDFYEQKCCYPPNFTLPRCATTYGIYKGGKGIKGGTEKYKSLYGADTKFVAVGPDGPNCGEYIIEQELGSLNCCEDAPPTVVNFDLTDDLIADDSSAIVSVDSVFSEIYWDLSAAPGLYLDAARTSKQGYSGKTIRVYSDEVCGALLVKADDGCDPVYATIRATTGQWVRESYWDHAEDFGEPGNEEKLRCVSGNETLTSIGSTSYTVETVSRYAEKLVEIISSHQIDYEGSPWDEAGYEGECNEALTEAPTRLQPWCCSTVYFSADSWHEPGGCCDSARCWPDACNTSCGGSGGTDLCYYCGGPFYVNYHYYGGPWRTDGYTLWRMWYYKWEC